jgi:exopolysaccharide biosynthesis polyprenyl glycosylphosphotransferase|uniref:Sugar transferase n=1 Tax=candidate division WOR-3 bacterium TaxID=2052148 RepID=A0A7C6A7U9_UNCW3
MYLALKRATDICLSLLGIVTFFPFGIIIGVLIFIESRLPIFYIQKRVGKDGKIFNLYKFRSMVNGAEKYTGPVWAKKNDPRVTSVGRFLRKTRLDELPQLFNVLKGEMSLVGPRPERPEIIEYLKQEIPDYTKRLALKPGLTGLAQVNHHYDCSLDDVRKKLACDFYYMENQNLLLDLVVFVKTISVVLTGRGAH